MHPAPLITTTTTMHRSYPTILYQHLVPPAIAFHFLLQEPFRRLDRGSIIFQCYLYISFWYFSECRSIIFQCYPYISFWYFSECGAIIFQCYLYISFWYFSECAWAHTIAFSQHITYFSFGGATESKEYKLPQQLASFYTPL